MRVLFLSQYFTPEPFLKALPFAKALTEMGYEVEALTGFPHYPNGKLYPGYRLHLRQRETLEGVPVTRVPLYPSHDRSPLRRVATYFSFALSAATLGALSVRRADVVYVYHPPGTVGLPACALRYLRGMPFVYDVQDLWPDTLAATGMAKSGAVGCLVGAFLRRVYRAANRITVLSPGLKAKLCERGVSADKIHVIYHWADDTILPAKPDPALAQRLGLSGRFNIMFAGTMGIAQALDAVLDAAGLLADQLPQAQFVFVGGGIDVERLQRKTRELNLANVRFLERRPPSEIGALLQLADVLLVHLKDDPLFCITIPSKTQAYMAAGKPILMAVRGDSANLVQRAKAGLCCTPGDPADIARAVAQLHALPSAELHRLGENGRRYYDAELSLRIGARRFAELFDEVARESRRSGRRSAPQR
jgi:colanic acid biosynthesis glycosyl transferase WcaI